MKFKIGNIVKVTKGHLFNFSTNKGEVIENLLQDICPTCKKDCYFIKDLNDSFSLPNYVCESDIKLVSKKISKIKNKQHILQLLIK